MERKENTGDVHKLISDDIPELYKKLCGALGDNLPLAKFSIGSGFYLWSDERLEWKNFEKADPAEQERILEIYDNIKDEIAEKVGEKEAEVICTIPNKSFIYYNNDDGNMQVLITGWAFGTPARPRFKPEKKGVKPKSAVELLFLYNGAPFPNYPFKLQTYRQRKPLVADENGVYSFKDLKIGEHYKFYDNNEMREFDLEIVEGQTRYPIDVTQYTTLRVRVLGDGLPIGGENVHITYGDDEYNYSTNGSGEVEISFPYYEREIDVYVRDREQGVMAQEGEQYFEFTFDTERPQQEQPPIPPEEPYVYSVAPYVIVEREDGTLLPGYPITAEWDGGYEEYTSDDGAVVVLPEMEEGQQFVVRDKNNPDTEAEFVIERDKSEYIFMIPAEKPKEKSIKVMFRDIKGAPIVCDNVTFRQKDRAAMEVRLNEEGDTTIKGGHFQVGQPISVNINGWENHEDYNAIEFVLEENEYIYLLQEREEEHDKKPWWPLILLLLATIIISIFLWLILDPNAFRGLFDTIYN